MREARRRPQQLKARRFESKELAEMETRLKDSIMGSIFYKSKLEQSKEHSMSSAEQKLVAEKTKLVKEKAMRG